MSQEEAGKEFVPCTQEELEAAQKEVAEALKKFPVLNALGQAIVSARQLYGFSYHQVYSRAKEFGLSEKAAAIFVEAHYHEGAQAFSTKELQKALDGRVSLLLRHHNTEVSKQAHEKNLEEARGKEEWRLKHQIPIGPFGDSGGTVTLEHGQVMLVPGLAAALLPAMDLIYDIQVRRNTSAGVKHKFRVLRLCSNPNETLYPREKKPTHLLANRSTWVNNCTGGAAFRKFLQPWANRFDDKLDLLIIDDLLQLLPTDVKSSSTIWAKARDVLNYVLRVLVEREIAVVAGIGGTDRVVDLKAPAETFAFKELIKVNPVWLPVTVAHGLGNEAETHDRLLLGETQIKVCTSEVFRD